MTRNSSVKPYEPDYDWFWGRKPGNDGTQATLRMTVSGEPAVIRKAVAAWISTLSTDSNGVRGEGGWRVDEVSREAEAIQLDITSGGEDVADGVIAGAESAVASLKHVDGIAVTWEQLPREDRYLS